MTHLLDDEGDGALLNVGTGNGERHTLALLAKAYYNKVTRLARTSNERCGNLKFEYLL